jgi:anti-sigma-K factor RskA
MVNANDTPAPDAAVETRSKALFDASVAELDASTRSRLCQARHAALEQAQRRPRGGWWMPALATAAMAALVAMILPRFDAQPQQQQPLSESLAAADDMTLLMNDESLDLLEEMEFYAWLAETPDAFDSPAEPEHTQS